MALDDLELVEPASREEWRSWLERNHAESPGVWLAVGKKGNPVTTLTYDAVVEEALAFGWIDSTVRKLDEHRFRQLLTPRKPGSTWARSNKERIERLTAQGRMTPAGLSLVEAAKDDGSWTLLDDIDSLVVPEDLQASLAENPIAESHFSAFPDSSKRMALYWISTAKRPGTRAKRIAEVVRMSAENRRMNSPGQDRGR